MTLEGILEVINSILKEDRKRVNIKKGHFFKVEELLYKEDDKEVDIPNIGFRIKCTFNDYNVIVVRQQFSKTLFEEHEEECKELIRYLFLEHFLLALKYGKGELDYNLFINDTYKGYNVLI